MKKLINTQDTKFTDDLGEFINKIYNGQMNPNFDLASYVPIEPFKSYLDEINCRLISLSISLSSTNICYTINGVIHDEDLFGFAEQVLSEQNIRRVKLNKLIC